ERTERLAGLFAASGGRAPVAMISNVGYGGGINGEIAMAPLSWSGAASTGTFSGLSALYSTDTTAETLRLKGRVDSLELNGEARVSLVGVDFALDRTRDDSGLYLGTGKVEVDQLAAVVDGQPAQVGSEILQSGDRTS